MSTLVIYKDMPVPSEDINAIRELLRNEDIIITSDATESRLYDLHQYLITQDVGQRTIRILFDRNIVSRVTNLALGRHINQSDKTSVLSAAAMAFFITAQCVVDPTMAIYEYGSVVGHKSAEEDLSAFRLADHIHPQQYANIALGRSSCVNTNEIGVAKQYLKAQSKPNSKETNFAKKLNVWDISYPFVLKMAVLMRAQYTPEQRIRAFFEWMLKDIFISAVAIIFALVYFGPLNAARLIKHVNSSDAEKLKHGIRNAAWDMAHINYWVQKAHTQNDKDLVLLCTCDNLMKAIARLIFCEDSDQAAYLARQSLISKNWPAQAVNKIIDVYEATYNAADRDPEQRSVELRNNNQRIDETVASLEHELGISA